MPRKPRIEYEGAMYHVMNRGNYQEDVFSIGDPGEIFEKIPFDACECFGWKLHAYVI